MLITERPFGSGIGELRTDAQQITFNGCKHRARGLYCDVHTPVTEPPRQIHDTGSDHWLAACEHYMPRRRVLRARAFDLFERHLIAGRVPRRIRGIAPRTAEIASRGAHKY